MEAVLRRALAPCVDVDEDVLSYIAEGLRMAREECESEDGGALGADAVAEVLAPFIEEVSEARAEEQLGRRHDAGGNEPFDQR